MLTLSYFYKYPNLILHISKEFFFVIFKQKYLLIYDQDIEQAEHLLSLFIVRRLKIYLTLPIDFEPIKDYAG